MLKLAHAVAAAAILYVLAVLFGAVPARAAAACGPWEDVLRGPHTKYGETPAYIAVMGAGAVLTITTNEITHSFTVLSQTTPDIMCAVSAGDDWRTAPDAIRKAPTIKRGKT